MLNKAQIDALLHYAERMQAWVSREEPQLVAIYCGVLCIRRRMAYRRRLEQYRLAQRDRRSSMTVEERRAEWRRHQQAHRQRARSQKEQVKS